MLVSDGIRLEDSKHPEWFSGDSIGRRSDSQEPARKSMGACKIEKEECDTHRHSVRNDKTIIRLRDIDDSELIDAQQKQETKSTPV